MTLPSASQQLVEIQRFEQGKPRIAQVMPKRRCRDILDGNGQGPIASYHGFNMIQSGLIDHEPGIDYGRIGKHP